MNERLARWELALNTFDAAIHPVRPEQWTAPTPCTEWDVRALMQHVVNEAAWVEPLVGGRTIAAVGDTLDGDLLGGDPLAAWHHWSGLAHEAFTPDEAFERTVHLSYGDESAAAYCDQLTFDLLIHAWDLARACGDDDGLPADLVTWGRGWIDVALPMYQQAGLVADPVPLPDDAGPQTQLLALVGRRGDWTA